MLLEWSRALRPDPTLSEFVTCPEMGMDLGERRLQTSTAQSTPFGDFLLYRSIYHSASNVLSFMGTLPLNRSGPGPATQAGAKLETCKQCYAHVYLFSTCIYDSHLLDCAQWIGNEGNPVSYRGCNTRLDKGSTRRETDHQPPRTCSETLLPGNIEMVPNSLLEDNGLSDPPIW